MLLHKDASVQLYGMHAWACLFPWDPMAMDFPERVTPLLEEDFMSQWGEEDGPARPSSTGDVPGGSRDLGPSTNGDGSASPARSRGNGGTVPGKRRDGRSAWRGRFGGCAGSKRSCRGRSRLWSRRACGSGRL